RLDRRSPAHQAREPHGDHHPGLGRASAASGISGEPAMSQLVETAASRELDEEQPRRDLERVWRHPSGIFGWFSYTTHQAIGKRYIITAFLFLLAGGIEALLMRLQLARA